VILGPRIEGQLRKTLQLSAGDVSGLWSEPIAVGIYILIALILLWPLLYKLIRRNRQAAAPAGIPVKSGSSGPRDATSTHSHSSHTGGEASDSDGDG
jgi:putative tricarboxylic transport membrane protein